MTRNQQANHSARHRSRGIEPLESRLLMARALGIDVSNYQPSINWPTVKSDGYDFAWAKATEGVTYDDPSFAPAADAYPVTSARMNAGKTAGLQMGAYHYARYDNNTAAAEVTHFLNRCRNYIGPGWLPPMLDVEAPVTSTDLNHTKAQISAWVNAWCNGILSATGVRPIVYTYISYASTYLDSTVTGWPLWMANYNGQNAQTGGPNATSPWSNWVFWQNNDTGDASYGGDGDVFNGTLTTLQTWVVPTAATTPVPTNGATVSGSPSLLNWADVSNALSYDVYVDNVFKTNVTTSQYSVPSSLANGNHTWQIKVKNNGGTTAGSTWNFNVQPSVILNAPTNLQVSGATSNSVGLTWTDNSTGEQYYLIERKTGSSGTYGQVGSVAANTVSFTDSAATDPLSPPQPGTTYYYRVRPYDGASSFGPYSAETSATTYAAVPANLSASDGTYTDKIHLSWDAAAGAIAYQIYRSTTNDPSAAAALDTSIASSYDDASAVAGTIYYYWVAAADPLARLTAKSGGDSGFADIAPAVMTSDFDYAQQGTPVMFTFNKNVQASLDVSDLTVTIAGTSDTITPTNVTYDLASNTASFWLPALADANYHAVLDAAGVYDANNNHPAASTPLDFFYLTADANHDAKVDLTDFTVLAGSFNGTGKSWSQGDFNYDTNVDLTDFTLLAANFNKTVPAPGPPAAAPAAASFSSMPITAADRLDPLADVI